MILTELKIPINSDNSKRLNRKITNLETLINELNERKLPEDVINELNNEIIHLNSSPMEGKKLGRQISKCKMKILQTLEKKLKIVPKHAYRGRWLAIGMSAFGVPLGVAYGAAMHNMAFIGIGIPIGMVIGMAIGEGMDKKAAKEGRQLRFLASEV